MICLWIAIFLAAFVVLAFKRASLPVWGISYGLLLVLLTILFQPVLVYAVTYWSVFVLFSVALQIPLFRRSLIAKPVMKVFKAVLPAMSATESEALLAGDVSWEGELFSGMPDWAVLQAKPMSSFTQEEQAFIDGPVEELCGMLNEWEITHQHKCIPEPILTFIKEHGFFGIIIPKSYGGLEFSAFAHAQIIVKVGTVCVAAATVISVPNSLGPAELLLHYGTQEQKDYYLPRLASGKEIPCFALTSPKAGSDAAGSMQDYGVVCRSVFEGKERLCIRLTWSKRYITLAPIASLLGLAFKLYDPEGLLGADENIGITCALIPVQTEGVVIGRRHYPLTAAFPNGPTAGDDVLIPIDWVIGGVSQVGKGWTMLMQCLAAGRGISLPSMAISGVKKAVYTSGVYAQVRQQFGVKIGEFDGIQAALAVVAGYGFMAEALRLFVLSDLDEGYQASVASAIAKAYTTQWSREVMLAAMDIHGGKAICMGPRNYLAQGYIESPICITVEGANILTRSLIIFGQGLIRCHPHLLKEMESCQGDDRAALLTFDKAFSAHTGYLVSNAVRTLLLGLTGGRLSGAPAGPYRRYMQKINRFSAVLGLLSDVAMGILGGRLKRMERLSERMGAIVGHLYAASAVLHYAQHNPQVEMTDFVDWSMKKLISEVKENAAAFLNNFPNRFVATCLKWWVFPFGVRLSKPSDLEDKRLAMALQAETPVRNAIVDIVYKSDTPHNPIGRFDQTLKQLLQLDEVERKLKQAIKAGKVVGYDYAQQLKHAIEKDVLTITEAAQLTDLEERIMDIIHVDDFSDDQLHNRVRESEEK